MFKIFPGTFTHDGRKVCIKEVGWKLESTTDQETINKWSQNYARKIKFWGIPTGAVNGLLVLDVDVKGGGLDTIKKYHVPITTTQKTISGGIHHIFKYPNDGKNYGNKVGFDSGLDIRGEGGYIANYGLDNTPMCDAPDWLLAQALSNKTDVVVDLDNLVKVDPTIVNEILNSACENILSAPDGESNNVLNVESYKVGQLLPSNSVAKEEAFKRLYDAAITRGKPDYEAKATITSGFDGGAKSPITCPFGNTPPVLTVTPLESPTPERWTPPFFTKYDLTNLSKLKKPQLFKDWSTEDIHITTADGGTGKTTLKLCEAIALALGEDFLGFKCTGEGRTLFITGEDTREKLGAMLGAILKQMGILNDEVKVRKVMNAIVVKKDSDLCLITKNKEHFINANTEALNKIIEAIEDIRPKMIVFDPISSFWGSEAALNDMAKAVAKFLGMLVEKSNACVEVINHMGKQSSNNKDMTQFAGRGGTGLPSHARVSRVLRPVFDDEYEELSGKQLDEGQSAMLCNVNKFSDGSPLYNKPFLIIREGFLFSRVTLVEQKVKEEQEKMGDNERIFTFIRSERSEKRYPTKNIVIANFIASREKLSKDRVIRGLEFLGYQGHMGEKIKVIDNPDIDSRDRVYVITDMEGKEL